MVKHFLDLNKIDAKELRKIITLALELKKEKNAAAQAKLLAHKNLAMIFEKPSTRTRVSFEVGINQLGGQTNIRLVYTEAVVGVLNQYFFFSIKRHNGNYWSKNFFLIGAAIVS